MKRYFEKTTSAAPLAVFRIALGALIFLSIVRFWLKGWIEELYIRPKYFFSYHGFEFVTPIGEYTYIIFAVCGIAALLVAIGLYYRIASIALFLSFTYIELMDKSTYLNHYYFISMVCLVMIFLPAHVYFSLDAARTSKLNRHYIPAWSIDVIKFFVAILYIYAGLAKVNSDWLLHAQPLRIWLPAKNDLPIIGPLFNYTWVPFAFSWIGCLYDLSIPFLLFNKYTRPAAYGAVVAFHVLTAILFPIGMFPLVMIATALIFFSAEFHERILSRLAGLFRMRSALPVQDSAFTYSRFANYCIIVFFVTFFSIQVLLPLRHLLYPGELFWTEEGYRFSWRVMLMEKAGNAQFVVKDNSGKSTMVDNSAFLTPLQEKMMSTQPDMILQYAHMLRDYYSTQGFQNPSIYADTYVVLNGRLGKTLIDPGVDLAKEQDSFKHKSWILPFENEITGF